MLPQQPDPLAIKKKQWLEAQHIRAAAVRRYTYGTSATATQEASALKPLQPVVPVGGLVPRTEACHRVRVVRDAALVLLLQEALVSKHCFILLPLVLMPTVQRVVMAW